MKRLYFLLILFLQPFLLYQQDFKDRYYIYDYEKYERIANRADRSVLKRSYAFKKVEQTEKEPYKLKDIEQKLYHLTYFLKKNKWNETKMFLSLHDSTLKVHQFYLGFKNFMYGKYEACLNNLKDCSIPAFSFYILLLKADCYYELNYDDTEILDAYQRTIDAATDEIQKKIIRDRVKYLRYKDE